MTHPARLLFALAFFLAGPASAAEITNDILAYEREILAISCDKITFMPGSIEMTDLNDDGRNDAIVDYQYLDCDGSMNAFCGSGGCTLRLYSGLADGRFAATADLLSEGLKIRKVKGKTKLYISLDGGACGKSGASSCTLVGHLTDEALIVESQK